MGRRTAHQESLMRRTLDDSLSYTRFLGFTSSSRSELIGNLVRCGKWWRFRATISEYQIDPEFLVLWNEKMPFQSSNQWKASLDRSADQ